MRSLVSAVGTIVSGDLAEPLVPGDTIVVEDGMVAWIGWSSEMPDFGGFDVSVDAQGSTVAPGLVDSHCHVVLGDYTPRQKTVDFLESYVHGGITSVISPGEIHAPGRPRSGLGVTALAIAAKECFDNFRPGGMRVLAGSVVLEPTLTESHFSLLEEAGVHLAKFGFGAYDDPRDGVTQVRMAQEHGITVTCHSGGASVPGSQPITVDTLLTLQPDVCGHINGGPTSLDERDLIRLIDTTDLALQIVQAGNIRSARFIVEALVDRGRLDRLVLGSDTPTGTGVMPLGVIKTVAELSSLTEVAPEMVWAAATGNVSDVWNLPDRRLRVGGPADLVVMDAPWGSMASDALGAMRRGDIPGISCVMVGGTVRVVGSRNTPAPTRSAVVTGSRPITASPRH